MTPSKTDPHEQPRTPIRLGVVVDGDRVPRYVNRLLDDLSSRPDMELAAVIVHRQGRIHSGTHSPMASLDRLTAGGALFFITLAEALVLRLRGRWSRPFRTEPIKVPSRLVLRLTPLPAEVIRQCNYSQADLDRLAELSLDFVVTESEWDPALGARQGLAKFGAIRMRFGELSAIPVRQAGFKEVCRRDPSSKFRIMSLHGRGDTAIFAGAFQTGMSLLGNRNALIRKAYPYLGQAIADRFAQPGAETPVRHDSGDPADGIRMECLLGCRELFASLGPRIAMIGTGLMNILLGRKEHWQIAWYRGDWAEVGTANCTLADSPAGSFLADPFVVSKAGRRICFAEEYKYRNRRGIISALELTQDSALMLGSIIEEPFHLSFPFVFEFESRLYMCPESAEAGQIRVYECVDYPLQWRFCNVLMDEVQAADTMLAEFEGRWWMFTNIDPQGSNDFESRMYLFWADNPLSSSWQPHPQNPVVFDPLSGRNAGLVSRDGALFRCAQRQGFRQYGEAFSVRQIIELTTERYEEQLHLEVGPENFGATGTHHIDHDGEFVVRDQCRVIRPR